MVRFWLLPLLHDSRLRTCFPRYDKQHDASDACNVADIMHMCRWYGTKRQDVFSNVAITIAVDASGKARRRVRILVETEGNASVVRPLDTECRRRNDTYRGLKHVCYPPIIARRKSFEEKNLIDILLVNFPRHFGDILNRIIRGIHVRCTNSRRRCATCMGIMILIIGRRIWSTRERYELLLKACDENTRFLDVRKIRLSRIPAERESSY